MEDHTQMSWKEDTIIGQLHNSVDNAAMAVGQALTNPSEQFIHQAHEMIERADRAVENALKNQGQTDPVSLLQDQLSAQKEKLNRLH
ncbi:hypothetical protein MHH33_16005 [Paenisporosarcina sp. FSL H8-0542]|uniref:hypothetical protein n=1 Tax=Paenisporosarcina sp. FSL H8-0542 TaxID=2921401 RepID=UPI00315A564F